MNSHTDEYEILSAFLVSSEKRNIPERSLLLDTRREGQCTSKCLLGIENV